MTDFAGNLPAMVRFHHILVNSCALGLAITLISCKPSPTTNPIAIGDQPRSLLRPQSRNPLHPLEVYFVRHAESLANFSGRYSTATERSFSPRAADQIRKLVTKLHSIPLDAAVVSPAWRTMNTAAPVLIDHHIVATIWPELYECCDQHGAARLLRPSKSVRYGRSIEIPPDQAATFKIDPSDSKRFAQGDYQDGMRQIKMGYDKFLKAFSGKSESVMIVGHGYNGSRLLEMFLGRPVLGKFSMANAGVVHLEQNPDGSFKLISLGGSVYRK